MNTLNKRLVLFVTAIVTSVSAASAQTAFRETSDLWGPRYRLAPQPAHPVAQHHGGEADAVRYWNTVAVNASGLDHTPVQPGENRVFGEQLGPTRASRAMA